MSVPQLPVAIIPTAVRTAILGQEQRMPATSRNVHDWNAVQHFDELPRSLRHKVPKAQLRKSETQNTQFMQENAIKN